MLKRFDHAMLAVRDINQAVEAYRKLGLEVAKWETVYNGGLCRQAFLTTGDDSFIEIMQPLDDKHDTNRYLARRGQGVYATTYQVDDLDASIARLNAQGIELIGLEDQNLRGGSLPPGGRHLVWIHPRHTPGMYINIQDSNCYPDLSL
jgi:methylmalonyl-CoA epimerase